MVDAMLHHFRRNEFDRSTAIARDCAPFVHAKRQGVEHAGASDRPLRFLSMSERALDHLIQCLVIGDDRGERQ
jgi:hypothetical protein